MIAISSSRQCAPGRADELRLSPERGNVCFASTLLGWSFTIKSFAKLYYETHGEVCRNKEEASNAR
jgi:hypothetical protein